METKMSFSDFAVVFLIWVPVGVNAISCPAPTLDRGYFLPVKNTYSENEVLFYGCDSEFKLDQDAWWAATTCTDGTWSTVPKCIAKDHCISPIIAHGEIQEKRADYGAGDIISINCQEGYHSEELQQVCSDGMWTPHPICKENRCGVIPQILNGEPHVRGKVVTYSCSSGYVLVGVATVHCLSDGQWSDPPACEAFGCSNRSEKGYHMYGFPKDQERRKKWMAMVHFENDQFKATKVDGMLKLRPNAVPTVFIHRPKPKRRKPPSVRVPPDTSATDHTYCAKLNFANGTASSPFAETTITSLPRQEAPIELCGAIPVVLHAEHEEFAWNVLYRCEYGYTLRTSHSRIYCYTDKLWSTPLPECVS